MRELPAGDAAANTALAAGEHREHADARTGLEAPSDHGAPTAAVFTTVQASGDLNTEPSDEQMTD